MYIAFGLALLLFLGLKLIPYNNCYTEQVYLFNQYNKSSFCDNCLLFNVTNVLDLKGSCETIGEVTINSSDSYTFYFGNEFNKREDLRNNDVIDVRWCYIKSIDNYRIRGIKANPFYTLWNRIDLAHKIGGEK